MKQLVPHYSTLTLYKTCDLRELYLLNTLKSGVHTPIHSTMERMSIILCEINQHRFRNYTFIRRTSTISTVVNNKKIYNFPLFAKLLQLFLLFFSRQRIEYRQHSIKRNLFCYFPKMQLKKKTTVDQKEYNNPKEMVLSATKKKLITCISDTSSVSPFETVLCMLAIGNASFVSAHLCFVLLLLMLLFLLLFFNASI